MVNYKDLYDFWEIFGVYNGLIVAQTSVIVLYSNLT